MKEYKGTDLKKLAEEGAYSDQDEFLDGEFMIAIGILGDPDEADGVTVPEDFSFDDLMEIEFSFGGNPRAANPESKPAVRKCTEAELGIAPGGSSILYPLSTEDAAYVKGFDATWYCADLKGEKMYGSFLTNNYRSLYIDFNEKEDVCKNQACDLTFSKAELVEIRSVYEILVLQNTQRFDSEDYKSSPPVVKEAKFQLLDMPSRPTSLRKYVTRAKMELDDNRLLSINGLTQVEHEYWEVEFDGTLRSKSKGGNLFHISYEMSSNGRADSRKVYSFFDVLGDAGGLLALLAAVVSCFLHVVNFNKAENSLVSELYKPNPADDNDSDKEDSPKPEQ